MIRLRHSRHGARAVHLFAAALALSGCARQDLVVAPADPAAPTPPSFSFSNGPASPGPIILRFPLASRVISTDLAKNLLAIHGTVTGFAACTDASTRVPTEAQRVTTPALAQNVAFLLKGEENNVAIYAGTATSQLFPFDPAKFCPFIENTVPLYTGQVEYRLHINGQGNLLFQWVGFVTRTSDGALFHYVENQFTNANTGLSNESIQLTQVGH